MNQPSPFAPKPRDGYGSLPPDLGQGRTETFSAEVETPGAGKARPAAVLYFKPGAEPVSGYRLVRMLGKGGFGEVWEATGPGGFPLALKFVQLHGSGSDLEVRSLEVMKNIRHPNLLALFGAWKTEDYLIVAMELGDRTLKDRLEECVAKGMSGIPAKELLEYVHEAAKGIDYLNEPVHRLGDGPPQGIQHRDIKPQNLLLVGGSVKVADFGLAKLLSQSVQSASGSMSPAYAAPEFCSGQATRWSDQYSLAVTYCQLRGNKLPFTGNIAQLVAGHLSHAPDLSMITVAKEREVLSRALLKQPSARWSCCREFADCLAIALGFIHTAGVLEVKLPEPEPLDSIDTVPARPPQSPRPDASSRTATETPPPASPPPAFPPQPPLEAATGGASLKLALLLAAALIIFGGGAVAAFLLLRDSGDVAKVDATAAQARAEEAAKLEKAAKLAEEARQRQIEDEAKAAQREREEIEKRRQDQVARTAALKRKAVAQVGNRGLERVSFSYRWRMWDGSWTFWQDDSLDPGRTADYERVGALDGELRFMRGSRQETVALRTAQADADTDFHKAQAPHQHLWHDGTAWQVAVTDTTQEQARERQRGVVVVDNPTRSGSGHILYRLRWRQADGHSWTAWTEFKLQNGYHYVHSWRGTTGCQVEFDAVGGDSGYTPKVVDLRFNNIPDVRDPKQADGPRYKFRYTDGTSLDLVTE